MSKDDDIFVAFADGLRPDSDIFKFYDFLSISSIFPSIS